jgi:hypothetical protein
MMTKQKKLYNKIDNNDNININEIEIITTNTKSKQILLAVYVKSSILILALSIFSLQTGLAQQQQLDENKTNNVPISINSTATSFTDENKKPIHVPNQIVVVAEDIEEIRDNLQEAREALNNAKYLQVLSYLNNIDKLLTAFVVTGPLTTDDVSNNLTASNISNDSTALAHLSNSSLIKKYNELIKDYNKESKKEKVIE